VGKIYEIFDHTADLGIRVFGKNKRDLFENAGFAIFDLLTDLKKVKESDVLEVRVKGEGMVDLVINWIRELLYLWNGKEFLIKGFEIEELENDEIRALLKGEKFDPHRHVINMEIKAVTYHKARVGKSKRGWWARVILDI
jgi:SHS2 domain-containing protein